VRAVTFGQLGAKRDLWQPIAGRAIPSDQQTKLPSSKEQPVSHVRAAVSGIRVERFGRGQDVLIAVADTTAEAQEARLSLDRAWSEEASGQAAPLVFRSELTGETIRAEGADATLSCRLSLPPHRTLVLRVEGRQDEGVGSRND
jgi:hypothetical protein